MNFFPSKVLFKFMYQEGMVAREARVMLGDEVTTEEMAENRVDTDTGEGNSENIKRNTPLKERENGCV